MQPLSLANIWKMWTDTQVKPEYLSAAQIAARDIYLTRDRYNAVASQTGVPFWFVGAIHYRESDFKFSTHLVNGDPLFSTDGFPIATTHVPKGLGPFRSWEEGAIAAFKHLKFDELKSWDISSALSHAESWNGHGYAKNGLLTPYVWSGTQHYTSGLFKADGVLDKTSIDLRPGVAAILHVLKQSGVAYNEIEPKLKAEIA